ncbi:MAG: MBL fold metallo-hydrolase, partial [Candidatus Korarchaeota archaeon]|nr:MBL fold metallo-hydrolase [Candidatus Korarchaeota archaeon]
MIVDSQAVAVDGGMPWTANRVLDYLNKNSLTLESLFLTHSHFDHVMGVDKLKKGTDANVLAHPKNKRWDIQLKDGD